MIKHKYFHNQCDPLLDKWGSLECEWLEIFPESHRELIFSSFFMSRYCVVTQGVAKSPQPQCLGSEMLCFPSAATHTRPAKWHLEMGHRVCVPWWTGIISGVSGTQHQIRGGQMDQWGMECGSVHDVANLNPVADRAIHITCSPLPVTAKRVWTSVIAPRSRVCHCVSPKTNDVSKPRSGHKKMLN